MIERWHKQGACYGHGPDLWFGSEQETYAERVSREQLAKDVCNTCPVISECLNTALKDEIDHGIWGGLTPAERRRIAKPRRVPMQHQRRLEPPAPIKLAISSPTPPEGYTTMQEAIGWSGQTVRLLMTSSLETWHGAMYAVEQDGEVLFKAVDEADAYLFFATVTMT